VARLRVQKCGVVSTLERGLSCPVMCTSFSLTSGSGGTEEEIAPMAYLFRDAGVLRRGASWKGVRSDRNFGAGRRTPGRIGEPVAGIPDRLQVRGVSALAFGDLLLGHNLLVGTSMRRITLTSMPPGSLRRLPWLRSLGFSASSRSSRASCLWFSIRGACAPL
jgi:hypothetical protein